MAVTLDLAGAASPGICQAPLGLDDQDLTVDGAVPVSHGLGVN